MMYISIVENHSGEQLLLRRLAPNESLDPEFYAHKWAQQIGYSIAPVTGYIPRGCADYYAETRRTKESNSCCWSSYDFYLDTSE